MIFLSLNAPGGSASVFLSLANALQDQGVAVDVYCYYFDPKSCFPELTKNLSITSLKKIHNQGKKLDNNSVFNKLLVGFDYYWNARKIFPLMSQKKYDLIYACEAAAYVPALLYKRKNQAKVYWSVFDPLSLVDRNRPGLMIHKYKWFEYLLQLHNVFDTKAIKNIDKVIVPTNKMKKQLDSFYGITAEVLPTAGVRIEDYKRDYREKIAKRLKSKFSFSKNKKTILFSSGHFLPHRRYEDTITAISMLVKKDQYVDIIFIISGSSKFDPSYFASLVLLVEKLKLKEYVIFDDSFRTNEEVIGYYQYCDIFLFVSTEQTWGLAPFEAMACRKPVIISRGVGCHEVLENKKTSIIVDDKSPKQITTEIENLLSNKTMYDALAIQEYHFVKEYFTYKSIAKKLITFFHNNSNNNA